MRMGIRYGYGGGQPETCISIEWKVVQWLLDPSLLVCTMQLQTEEHGAYVEPVLEGVLS